MTETIKHIQGDVQIAIDRYITEYPQDQKQSAVMPALMLVQKANGGSLDRHCIEEVAHYLDMSVAAVNEVATFYSMYEHKPVGKHKLAICTNISCMLRGCDELVDHLKNRLDVGVGEVTDDGLFSIKQVECLGACGGAPVMHLGDRYVENLTKESLDTLIDELTEQSCETGGDS